MITNPNDIDLENSVLVSAFVDSEFDAWDILEPEHFYSGRNKAICSKLIDLKKRNEPLDVAIVAAELKADAELRRHLSGLFDLPVSTSPRSYISKIKNLWQLRQFLSVANAVLKRVANNETAEDVSRYLSNEIERIGAGVSGGWVHIGQIMEECVERAEEISKNHGITGVPTGFIDLDWFTAGFQPGDLIILAARPGMGKTAFACNTIASAASSGIICGLISLEMVRGQIGNRFLAMRSMIDALKFRSGRFSEQDFENMVSAAENIGRLGIWVDDMPRASYHDCENKLRELVRHKGGRFAVIDYLGFLDGDKDQNKVNEVQSVTRALKSQAKEFGIPIVLICQLSRECERRTNKRPILSDLRDSGAIEQDADVVLFLYRDDYYSTNSKEPGIVEVSIAKQRNGPTGTIKLVWDDRYTLFKNLIK